MRLSEDEVRRTRLGALIIVILFALIFAGMLVFGGYRAWLSDFTPEKWRDYPEKRAYMQADLLREYDRFTGMTVAEVTALLGEDNSGMGYFNEDGRLVYYMGSERTIIDSEWLLIETVDGIVTECSWTTD